MVLEIHLATWKNTRKQELLLFPPSSLHECGFGGKYDLWMMQKAGIHLLVISMGRVAGGPHPALVSHF